MSRRDKRMKRERQADEEIERDRRMKRERGIGGWREGKEDDKREERNSREKNE